MHVMETIRAYQKNDPAARSAFEVFWLYNGLHAILWYRIAHWLHIHGCEFLARWISQHAKKTTGVEIHPAAKIGRRLVIDHGTGVVIGETTVIGSHAKIYQGVTLGATSTRKGQQLAGVKRHPTLGDYVTVYSNASILGGDTFIGDGAVIGGSVFVCESVPANARVGMQEQKLNITVR